MIFFQKDWSEQKVFVHTETRNLSFIKMSMILNRMGITNCKFMLALHNPDLAKYDPHNLTDPSLDLRLAIAQEAKSNIWYYMREIARLPAQGGDPIPFKLDRANMAMIWLHMNHVDLFSVQPRQTGKTMGVQSLAAYIMYIYGRNLKMAMLTKDTSLVQENVSRLKGIRNVLPSWLVYLTTADTDNKEGLSYAALNNEYRTYVAQKDPQTADNLGRGMSSPWIHIDEIGFCRNIHITFPAMIASTLAAVRSAKANNQPHSNLFTSTAARVDTPSGAFAFKQFNKAMPFRPALYDCRDYEHLHEVVAANSDNRMVSIVHSYLQLGYTHEWFRTETKRLGATEDDINRDFLNIWKAGSDTGVLPVHIITKIKENEREPTFTEMVGHNYIINWYVEKTVRDSLNFMNRSFIIGMDSSENVGKDFTSLVMIDVSDMSVVATLRFNDANILRAALFIIDLLVRYKNSIFIPERNSTGCAIIDILLEHLPLKNMNPYRKIFNQVVQQRHDEPRMQEIDVTNRQVVGVVRKHFGFRTQENSRNHLYQHVLMRAMELNTERLYDSTLIHELCALQTKNGRVDHGSDGHDDTVIAYLLACYVIFSGKNLQMYDLKSDDILSALGSGGSTDAEAKAEQMSLRKMIREQEKLVANAPNRIVRLHRMMLLKQMVSQLDESMIFDPISAEQLSRDHETYNTNAREIVQKAENADKAVSNFFDTISYL